ncbi:MAG: hypothetical protein QNJ47_14765 [Nostocaceae cyanobacterium]|nr:hypothetical protein [Nostocaceae cyanobacterium]
MKNSDTPDTDAQCCCFEYLNWEVEVLVLSARWQMDLDLINLLLFSR